MKILLTGKPGIGKSTILEKVKNNFSGNKFGVISKEIVDELNSRVGFEAINHLGEKKTFAHITDIESDFVVGNKYFVDLETIDNFVVPELKKGISNPDSLVFIDEIGRMQSFSHSFLKTIKEILSSNSNVLGTIVYDQEPWSIEFKENKSVVLIEVSKKNRNLLPELLITIFENPRFFHKLTESQQELIVSLTREYFEEGEFTQISKLFNNAIKYIVKDRVKKIAMNKFEVNGNSNTHRVMKQETSFECDCDLFNGSRQYENNQGECSHIQATKLFDSI